MKNTKKLFLFAFVATLAIVGCTKDEDEKTYSADISINGTKTTFQNLIFYSNGSSVTIEGQNEDDDIYIYLAETSTGTKKFGGSNGVELSIGGKSYSSVTGSLIVTESDDSAISGTFSGTFEVSSSTQSITISGSFTAKQNNPFEY